MGLLTSTGHDVFLSYARADDQDDYIPLFRERLIKTLPGVCVDGLRRPAGDPDVFLDSQMLEANGSLRGALKQHVTSSEFLFVFVGDAYANSSWCLDELSWFLEGRFAGKPETARDHVFIICLTRTGWEALDKIGSRKVHDFWSDQIRVNFYGDDGLAIPPFAKAGFGDRLQVNPDFRRPFDRILRTIKRRAASAPEAKVERPAQARRILLGAVTPDLATARTELRRALAAKGATVDALELSDLMDRGLKARILAHDMLVVPVSDAELQLPVVTGGHLAIQRNAAEGSAPICWWCPPSSAPPTARESDSDNMRYIQEAIAEARKAPADALAEELIGRPGANGTYARIFIESSQDEINCWERLWAQIERAWRERYDDVPLLPTALSFHGREPSARDALRGCDGIVLVYGRKDFDALQTQAEFLLRRLVILRAAPARAVATLVPPQRNENVDHVWFTVPFSEEDGRPELHPLDSRRLGEFVERLYRAARARGESAEIH